jgi:hypothetical protein
MQKTIGIPAIGTTQFQDPWKIAEAVSIDTDILLSRDPFDAEKWENGPMVKRQPDIKEKKVECTCHTTTADTLTF